MGEEGRKEDSKRDIRMRTNLMSLIHNTVDDCRVVRILEVGTLSVDEEGGVGVVLGEDVEQRGCVDVGPVVEREGDDSRLGALLDLDAVGNGAAAGGDRAGAGSAAGGGGSAGADGVAGVDGDAGGCCEGCQEGDHQGDGFEMSEHCDCWFSKNG